MFVLELSVKAVTTEQSLPPILFSDFCGCYEGTCSVFCVSLEAQSVMITEPAV